MKRQILSLALAAVFLATAAPTYAGAYAWNTERELSQATIKEIPKLPYPWKEYPPGSKEQLALEDWMREYFIKGFLETPEGKIMGEQYLRDTLSDDVFVIINNLDAAGSYQADAYGEEKGEIRSNANLAPETNRRSTVTHEAGHAVTGPAPGSVFIEPLANWIRRQVGLVYGYDYFRDGYAGENYGKMYYNYKAYAIDTLAKTVGQEWFWTYFKRTPELKKTWYNVHMAGLKKRLEEKQDVISWDVYFEVIAYLDEISESTAKKLVESLYYIAENPKFDENDKTHKDIRDFFTNTLKIENVIPAPPEAPVYDLDTASFWTHDAIAGAINAGYVPAEIQGDFSDVITRKEFCRMAVMWMEKTKDMTIEMILDEKGVTRDTDTFTDTKDPYVLAAYALGVVGGSGNGTFNPYGQFTREEAAAMTRNVCEAVGMDTSSIKDAGFADMDEVSGWAADGVNFCRASGIMSGSGDPPVFKPKETYTREQSIMTFYNIKWETPDAA